MFPIPTKDDKYSTKWDNDLIKVITMEGVIIV